MVSFSLFEFKLLNWRHPISKDKVQNGCDYANSLICTLRQPWKVTLWVCYQLKLKNNLAFHYFMVSGFLKQTKNQWFFISVQNIIKSGGHVQTILTSTFSWSIMPVWLRATAMVTCAFARRTSVMLPQHGVHA